MAGSTVHFRVFQLQGWLELLHHWAQQDRPGPLGALGGRLCGPKAGLEGWGGSCLERRRRKGHLLGKAPEFLPSSTVGLSKGHICGQTGQ